MKRILSAAVLALLLAGCNAPEQPHSTPYGIPSPAGGEDPGDNPTHPVGSPDSTDPTDSTDSADTDDGDDGDGANHTSNGDAANTPPPATSDGCGHDLDPTLVATGYNLVIDAEGQPVRASGRPTQQGYSLQKTATYVEAHNDREYAEIFTYMAPIRDALMCEIADTTQQQWTDLTEVLTINDIKTHQDLSGRPNQQVYSSSGIYQHLKDNGPDQHPMMKYLEEAELELKCLAFKDFDFTNPEGENHCANHGIPEGAGFQRP